MRTVNMTTWLAMGFLAVVVAGCARPDWIEQTLVTVDVTGEWRGRISAVSGGYGGGPVELTLQQSGPKVTGWLMGTLETVVGGSVPIEGTISGDIFRFHDIKGSVTGELQVNGDEMNGSGTARNSSLVRIDLRRQR